ncbi:MAG TPA: carboxypeptidase-like regulatory domain-containing protein [Terriglobia bacterium]|nr:carboxypeptidase-like regulatory domain-containing protein [Terriglobia bacterium]
MKYPLIALALALLLAATVEAQTGMGKLTGSVVEAGHATLPGVTVTATDEKTGLRQSILTGDNGVFSFVLPPGNYTLTLKLFHFRTVTIRKLSIPSGKTTTVDAILEIDGREYAFWPSVDVRRFEVGANAASSFRQSGSEFVGGQSSLVVNLSQRAGIVGEFSALKEVHPPHRVQMTYTIGPRLYLMRTESRLTGFTELMLGRTRVTSRSSSVAPANGSVILAGGGLDWKVRPWLSMRVLEADYSFTRVSGDTLRGVRASSGLIFHFGREICPCEVTY